MTQPEIVEELLSGPYPCCITTLGSGGEPYAVVVWCAPEGDSVTVNAADGRWLKNLRRDPRVSLVVVDTRNILRHVAIQGVVQEVTPDEEYEHMDRLSQIYEGRRYQYSTPEEEPRFKVVIDPQKIRTLDISPPQEEIR